MLTPSAPSTSMLTRPNSTPETTYHSHKTSAERLNRAIESGNINLVKRLLANKQQDPRNQDPVTKKTSLILATEQANLEICQILIQDYQVDSQIISRDLENNTVLHLAAAEGLDDIITLYHHHYPSVLDWANSEGMTALHVASQKGNESTVSLLLDLQADVELTDNQGNTSLHYAAAWGHLKIVLLLIDRGSPFWAKNNQTFTASDYAFSFQIQSALQESARAHFESKKQQRHQRQHREKDRTQRATPPTVNADLITTRTSRLGLKDSHSSAPRSATTTPQSVSTPFIPKISTSPTTSVQGFNPAPPKSPSISSKPLASPTNSIAAARTVSYLISKDLEAIQDFRTRSISLATTTTNNNHQNQQQHHHHNNHINNSSSSASSHTPQQTHSASLPPVVSDSPTTPSSNHSRLLPLQLVSAAASVGSKSNNNNNNNNGTGPSLRPRSSTGNLNSHHTNPDGTSRHRAGSTDSENGVSLVGSSGAREGLSRLRYLKSGPSSSTSSGGGGGAAHLTTSSSSSPVAAPAASGIPRPTHLALALDPVPGSPDPSAAGSSSSQLPTPTCKPLSSISKPAASTTVFPTSPNPSASSTTPTPATTSTNTTTTTGTASANYFPALDGS
ncbi:hypothetical protein PCASD_17077 [Puccinia coronata f. sp. avenae]|uniref:Uncharacterized protein n=1 Tax=Puccinia coronata f. sp. avenae TaxID=200324 RepID=A0A2N5TR16_9BASI|nr:hypothetical protein PCASD_17077 [Puccinia coronata f. sp. avenae]